MAMTLNDFRKKIPQLEGLDDEAALNLLHEVYYPDADKARMATALGVKITKPEPVRPQNTLMGFIGDRGLDLVKGAVAVPEAAVGVADLVSGGAAGRAAEEIGFRPREAKEILSGMQSDAYHDRQAQFQAADGIVAKTGVALTNPSLIAGAVTESLPLMAVGGVVGRGVMAAAPKLASPVVAGALGEGAVAAGSTAEQVRQQTADGYLTPKQAVLSAAAGVGTAAFGYAGAKAAKAMGIADLDTALVQGSMQAARDSQIGVIKRVAGGMFAEGVLEELPQSVVEQMAQNIALDKPLMQDVDSAIVMGALSGAAMGGGAALLSRPPTPTEEAADTIRANKVPEAGTLSKAVNVGIEESAKAVEATAPAPSLTNFDPATMIPENPLLAGARVRENDSRQEAMTDQAMAKLERMNANDMAVINSARFDQSRGANEISPTEVVEPAQAGDILNPKGEPFKNKAAALTASKKYGGQVVQVMEGWAVRGGNKESANVGTSVSAATVAAGSGGQLGADAAGGQRDRGRDDAGAGGGAGDAAPAAARRSQPGEPVRTAGQATPALTNEQNAATRPAPQGQAPQSETPTATGGDEAGTPAKPAAAGPAQVEAAGVEPDPRLIPVSQRKQADGFENLLSLKSTKLILDDGRGRKLYDVQVTPAFRNRHFVNGRMPVVNGLELKHKADVTGVPSDNGWVLIDNREQLASRNVPKNQANLNTSAEPAQKTAKSEQVDSIAQAINASIADGAIKKNSKFYAENVAKGYMTQEEADRRAAADAKTWSEQKPTDRTLKIAKAIADKDPTVLVGAWANEGQGTYGNEGSMEAFRKLTGINLKRLNSADRAKAIFDWAGWSEDQVRADVEKRKAAKAEAAAAYEAKEAAERAEMTERQADKTPLRVQGKDGETTVKAYVDDLIAQGYTDIGQTQKGAVKQVLLFNPKTNSGYPMPKGILADYAKQAVEKAKASKAAQQPAEGAKSEPFEHAGLKIRPSRVKEGDQVVDRWVVQSPENAEREARGERQIGGDRIVETREQAIKTADQEAKRYAKEKADRAEMDAREKAERDAAEARREANKGKTLTEIKADGYMAQEVKDGKTGDVLTRAEWVKRLVDGGAKLSVEMVNKIKPMSRAAFNRATNQEQAAHEKKVKAAGQVPEYSIGDFIVTKTEYDFAQTASVAIESVASEPSLPDNWRSGTNQATNRPTLSYNPQSGAHWATVHNVIGNAYEIEYRKGQSVVESVEVTGSRNDVIRQVQERVAELSGTPIHQDPGKAPEAATAPVIAQSLAKAARKEDHTQKEMRLWLVGEIDKAVKLTEDYADYQQKIKEYGQSVADSVFYGKANGSVGLTTPPGNATVTFDVPGDGKFKIRNSLRGLMEFRAKVEGKSGTGFTDKPTKPKGLPASTGVAKGSSNQIEALSNMLEELDFEAAVDYARETGVSLNDAKVPPHIRDQLTAYLKDGTLPPAPFSPTRYWEYQASSRADKDGNPIREASLTKEIGADTYIANVTGTNATGFTFTVTKGAETFEKKSGTFRTFSDALQGAESKIASIQPEVVKPKDTGWNMRGTGYAGKRYIGRNITLDDGREVVARIYENAGQYEDAEVKVDGVSKFRKTDRYKAEKLADDFIRTLTAKEPAKAPIKVTPQVSGNAEKFIKVAADSVDKLRQVDVERVLSETPVHFRAEVSAYIKSNRAGLSDEVDAVMADLNEPAQASQTEPKREFRNPDNLNVLHAPIEDKDWFKLKNGEEWQARQGYSGRGWSLVRAGSLHPEARNLESQSDFIRSVIEVTGQTQAAGQVVAPVEANDEPIPAVSEAQARKQFEWRNMGQKDGTKSHLLFFFESEKDKGTGAAMNRGEVSLYPGASGWKVEDGDGTSYKSLADAKKAAIDLAIPKLQDQGYILKPAQAATAILDAANVTGKERIDALKDVKKGDITPEELQAAYPAKDSATFPNTAQGAIDAFNADDSTQAVAIMAKLKLDDLKEVGGAVGFRPQIGENAKAFRERIGTVADKLTKTSREQTSREMTLHKRLTQLASDYDRAIAHRDRAIANGAEAGSSAFEGQYEGQWTTIDKGLAILENALQEESKSPDYAKVSAMVKEARPAIFDAAKPDDSVKAEAKSEISDFGEVLPGARKDAAPSLKTELSDNDIATQPLSKIWPADEYLSIDDKFASALSFAARAEIPAKPRTSYKVNHWVEKVKTVRNLAQRITSGSVTRERMAAELAKTRSLSAFADKVALLEAIDREHWPRIDSVEVYPDAYRYNADGTQTKTPLVRVSIDGRSRSFDGATSVADVVERVIAMVDTEQKQTKKMQFEVRGTESKGFGINKKGDKEYRKLKTFPTAKEAFEFIKTGYVDLVVEWEGVKDRDNVKEDDVRGTENRPRTAKDYRNGKDVTSEQFAETFGFRGGQFGNWVNQGEGRKDRQGMLNQAYDALMDLADIVGIPPKAVSLNGTLGIAFGARGSGKASAHYEPDTLVINLTKTRGAGVLAHEWFHALDNYFSHQRGGAVPMSPGMTQLDYRKANYITYKPEPLYVHKTKQSTPITKATLERYAATSGTRGQPGGYYDPENWHLDPRHPEGVRPEVERRIAELVEALNASPMAQRAASNDKAPEGYWSRIIERAARSFENYVISKMMERGYHNDYLANVREVGDFPRSKERYPYLLPEEVKPIAEAFDNLFATVQTKETDKGVAMFARGNNSSAQLSKTQIQRAVDKLTLNWLKKPDIHILDSMDDAPDPVRRVWQSQDSKGARGKIEGFHYKGGVYIVADAMESGTDIIRVLFHESLGHFGLRNVFGTALDGILKQIAAARPADMRRKATQYGFDLKNDRDRMAAAEELLAEMAQARPEIGFVQRAIAAIRTWLRENVPYFRDMELSDAEIVRNFLEPARGFVERGIRGGESIRAALAFSKAFQPVWYSALQNSIGSLNMKAAPATGWASTIDGLVKAGKVKADEVEWSGVKEWLQLQTGKVTREQVMEYLDANGVQVQEVTLGGDGYAGDFTIGPVSEENYDEYAIFDEEGRIVGDERFSNDHDAVAALDRMKRDMPRQSKYSQYTLPGGENYREVLLTLPERKGEAQRRFEALRDMPRDLRGAEVAEYERLRSQALIDNERNPQNFRSSHWDQPNVLAHLRLNDRTDADGKRVLFVEEIQSDWGQEGKKKGFGPKNKASVVQRNGKIFVDRIGSATTGPYPTMQQAQDTVDSYNRTITGVPLAPFVTNTDKWLTLALKRVITMAAQEGYDRVAFVNGEQSAARYDLSKQVDRIEASPGRDYAEGVYDIDIWPKNDRNIVKRGLSSAEVEELVGKDLASKIVASVDAWREKHLAYIKELNKPGTPESELDKLLNARDAIETAFTGDGLKVGGEGMKAFYDTIVPNTLKALLKKVGGGQLESVEVGVGVNTDDTEIRWTEDSDGIQTVEWDGGERKFDTEAEARAFRDSLISARSKQTGFTITPTMREKVAGGLPLFSRQVQGKDQTDTPAFQAWFGDSKVVDADGKARGTTTSVPTFDNASGDYNPDLGAFWLKKGVQEIRGDGMSDAEYHQAIAEYANAWRVDELLQKLGWKRRGSSNISSSTYFTKTIGETDEADGKTYEVRVSDHDDRHPAGDDIEQRININFREGAAQWSDADISPDMSTADALNRLNGILPNESTAPSSDGASAIGNRGTFDPNDADIRFSRAADLRKEAAGQVVELFHTATNVPGRMNWWHKTVGTMYNLAQRSPEFKRVFSAVQDFIDDTAYYADRAARLAPNILPKLETWRDVFKSPMSAVDNRAIRAPIFEGTLTWMRDESGKPVKAEDVRLAAEDLTTDQKAQRLLRNDFVTDSTLRMWRGLPLEQYESIIEGSYERHMLRAGIVFTPAELKSLFKLTDGQVKLYQEFRRATDMSLTNLAISEMVKLGGQDTASMRQAALESEDVVKASAMLRDHLLELADSDAEKSKGYIDAANKIIALSDKAKNLMDKGYAPLSRFGHYTVDVVGPDGTREYFGMFESRFEAAKMAEAMAKNYPDARIERGTVSEQAYKLFAGVTPETIELFGEILGLDTQGDGRQNQAFKAFVQRATANRSAMKRLLERKGIAGFSEDAGRVLAGFVFSNGRRTAGNLHGMEMKEAAEAIPKQQGELKDHAVALVEYVQNPQEEAQGLRGLLFTQYIGGSIASAIVNMTQPITMSLPYLSQFGGITQAGRQMARAVKDVGKTTTGDKALDAAMTAAEEKGIVSPQEVHQLQQQAAGRAALQVGDGTMAGDARAKAGNALSKTMLAWGKLFSAAEQFNRRVTFIAAYRTAVDRGIENPAKFAEDAVIETQGLYNKGNKPKWARGAIGSTLFTFKQYSVAYVEMLGRLAQSGPEGRRAALYALAILFMLSGAGGMPGADDLDDLISGLMQKLGYNFNSKSARRAFFAKHLGQAGSDFVERGVSGLAGVPIDISGRMGLGNLIPGTGLLTKKTDHTSDVAELAGPAGDLAKRAFQAGSKAMDGDLIGKDGAVTTLAPLAVRNLSQAADMAKHGMYRDARGRKVVETDQLDALSKAFGFQPNDVKRVQDATREVQQMISLNKIRETEIADQWAKAMFERDKDGVQEARDALKRWNADNPESPIRISMQQINKRLANMRMSKEDRMAKTASKEIRATVRRELEAAR